MEQNIYFFFENTLLKWSERHGRHTLPWRDANATAYTVWVSEIMLQQTQVNRVIPYYIRFLQKFPTIFSLAQATWQEFYPYYAGLGYYRRGKNMLLTAQMIVEKYNGEFPSDKKLLLSLPGIGEYTASAVLSFAYNQNEFAYDTNAARVLGRFFFGHKNAVSKNVNWNECLSANKKILNAAIMDFASLVCTKKPSCATCPLQKNCVYAQNNGQTETSVIVHKNSFPAKKAQTLLFLHQDHQTYFSSATDHFQPFFLPCPHNTRASIKAYFKKHFNLELAVRPPYKKIFIDTVPTFITNAQIVLGNPTFPVFKKDAIQNLLKPFQQAIDLDTYSLKKGNDLTEKT